jgi:hypothetical protein
MYSSSTERQSSGGQFSERMSKKIVQKKRELEPPGPHAGFAKIVHWEAYDAFRSRALAFLVLYDVLLVVANVCLAYSLAFGQVLAAAAVIAGAVAVFAAIRFSEGIETHFKSSPEVQATIRHAEEHLGEPATAINFIKTIDGQLVILTLLLGLIMIVQFWNSLH